MTLHWPKDAGDFAQHIDLNEKDDLDIQSICKILMANKIITRMNSDWRGNFHTEYGNFLSE